MNRMIMMSCVVGKFIVKATRPATYDCSSSAHPRNLSLPYYLAEAASMPMWGTFAFAN